ARAEFEPSAGPGGIERAARHLRVAPRRIAKSAEALVMVVGALVAGADRGRPARVPVAHMTCVAARRLLLAAGHGHRRAAVPEPGRELVRATRPAAPHLPQVVPRALQRPRAPGVAADHLHPQVVKGVAALDGERILVEAEVPAAELHG